MDAIRYMVMGAWKKIKRWLPVEIEKEEDLPDISKKEIEEDEYI